MALRDAYRINRVGMCMKKAETTHSKINHKNAEDRQ